MALKNSGLDKSALDMVVFATLTPDAYFPGSGCFLQAKMALPNIPCLDIRMQCSGFVYGLSLAEMYIKAGKYKNILVVGAEVQSTAIDYRPEGRTVGVLFGDGAGFGFTGVDSVRTTEHYDNSSEVDATASTLTLPAGTFTDVTRLKSTDITTITYEGKTGNGSWQPLTLPGMTTNTFVDTVVTYAYFMPSEGLPAMTYSEFMSDGDIFSDGIYYQNTAPTTARADQQLGAVRVYPNPVAHGTLAIESP